MTFDEIFNMLDLNHDGEVSRSELHVAATDLGWRWQEAPILAVLDLLTMLKPLSRDAFNACMNQIYEDPLGPYGKVLLKAPHFLPPLTSEYALRSEQDRARLEGPVGRSCEMTRNKVIRDHMLLPSDDTYDMNMTNDGQRRSNRLHRHEIWVDDAALLIIDPQRSFTEGVWMRSIGSQAENEVRPIRLAFNRCAHFLKEMYHHLETMFTRCPFPPDSYDWDVRLAKVIHQKQLYFIKPGNSVLFPPTNGFREWAGACINNGKSVLVMGGCTLNSCIRVSSVEVQRHFGNLNLQVVVDLSLCGARASNYLRSPMYNGLSAVESAIREMITAGVTVVRRIEWKQKKRMSHKTT